MIRLIGGEDRETKSNQVGIRRMYSSETKLIMKYLHKVGAGRRGLVSRHFTIALCQVYM